MATFLDLSLFQNVSGIFIFILVFLVVYAFLNMSKIFKGVGGHNGIYAIVALAIAFLSSFSTGFVAVIMNMAPWFTVIIVFLFLVFFVVRMFTTDDKLFESMIKEGAVKWVLIIVFVIILLVSVSNAFGQKVLEQGTGQTSTTNGTVYDATTTTTTTTTTSGEGVATNDFGTNFTQTMFHPKILGMLLVVLIAFFTILLIAKTAEPN